jgi:hypothetical protein
MTSPDTIRLIWQGFRDSQGRGRERRKEASASFLKKRSKKLSFTVGFGACVAGARRSESFFASFFSKKEVLALTKACRFFLLFWPGEPMFPPW